MKEALIDTDILSYFFKGDLDVIKGMQVYLKTYPKLNISIITKYEIISGLEYENATRQLEEFDLFLETCEVINLSDKSIRIAAAAFGELKRKGVTLGTSDLLIAGIAIEKQWQLITNNEKHFREIGGLEIANWKK
jgi:tRNA(fMet)-specific endonuclease VapC